MKSLKGYNFLQLLKPLGTFKRFVAGLINPKVADANEIEYIDEDSRNRSLTNNQRQRDGVVAGDYHVIDAGTYHVMRGEVIIAGEMIVNGEVWLEPDYLSVKNIEGAIGTASGNMPSMAMYKDGTTQTTTGTMADLTGWTKKFADSTYTINEATGEITIEETGLHEITLNIQGATAGGRASLNAQLLVNAVADDEFKWSTYDFRLTGGNVNGGIGASLVDKFTAGDVVKVQVSDTDSSIDIGPKDARVYIVKQNYDRLTSSGDMPMLAIAKNSSVQATTGTYATVTGWDQDSTPDSRFSPNLTNGEITINEDGLYLVLADIQGQDNAGNRTQLDMKLQISPLGGGFVDDARHDWFNYASRNATQDNGGVWGWVPYTFSATDKIRLQVQNVGNPANINQDKARIYIIKLGHDLVNTGFVPTANDTRWTVVDVTAGAEIPFYTSYNVTANSSTYTLPNITANDVGRECELINDSGLSQTIDPDGSDTIEGSATGTVLAGDRWKMRAKTQTEWVLV